MSAQHLSGYGDTAQEKQTPQIGIGIGWSVHGGNRTREKMQILFFCGPFSGLRQFVARQRVAFCSSGRASSIALFYRKSW